MVAKVDDGAARGDKLKLLAASAVVVLSVAGFYAAAEFPVIYRVVGLLIGLGVAVAVIYSTAVGRSLLGFVEDSRTEVRKVVWPTRQETMQTTLIVMVIVVIIGLFLWLLDWGLGVAFRALTGIGG